MRKVIFRVLLIFFVLLFAISGYFIGAYVYESKKARSAYDDFSLMLQAMIADYETDLINKPGARAADSEPVVGAAEGAGGQEGVSAGTARAIDLDIEDTAADPRLRAYRDLSDKYPDFIGRISIPGTVVSYPVMHTPDDPEYYLDHNIEKERNNHGTPFLDFKCDAARPSDNMTIYGHHMKDGSMFACLNQFKDKAYYQSHSIIEFDTLYDIGIYEVVAIFVSHIASGGEYAFKYFMYTDFEDRSEFDEYMSLVREYRLYDTGVEAEYGDRLLSLSTCDYTGANSRMVLLARKVSS